VARRVHDVALGGHLHHVVVDGLGVVRAADGEGVCDVDGDVAGVDEGLGTGGGRRRLGAHARRDLTRGSRWGIIVGRV
jgi:hypothetical protein